MSNLPGGDLEPWPCSLGAGIGCVPGDCSEDTGECWYQETEVLGHPATGKMEGAQCDGGVYFEHVIYDWVPPDDCDT